MKYEQPSDENPINDISVRYFSRFTASMLERYASYRTAEAEASADLQTELRRDFDATDDEVARCTEQMKVHLALLAIRSAATTPHEAGDRLGYDPDELARAAAQLTEPDYLAEADRQHHEQPPEYLDGPDHTDD